MRRRLISWALCIVLILALFPIGAAADEDFNSYTPYDLTAELMKQDETHPYGSALLTFKINNLPRSDSNSQWYAKVEKKIGDNLWVCVNELDSNQCLDYYQKGMGKFEVEQLWNEDYSWDGTVPVSFRVCVTYYSAAYEGASPWSETVTIGLKSSSWAVTELQKASYYGLIPDSLKGADMTQPITREEFAEIAVKLYELYTGKKAQAGNMSFTDTTNPEILKAANLGLVMGVGNNKYAPKQLVTREQMATIMLRALKVINPVADYSTAGAAKFADDKQIESWARDGVYYCSKAGILKGTGNNMFNPDGNSTRESAVIACTRSYELFRQAGNTQPQQTTESDTLESDGAETTATQDIGQFIIGKWSCSTDDGTFFYHFKDDKTLEVSKENDQTGGYLSFKYELTDNQLTVFYYSTTEFTLTEDGITEPEYSNKQIFQQCVVRIVDSDTLLMDDFPIVRVK